MYGLSVSGASNKRTYHYSSFGPRIFIYWHSSADAHDTYKRRFVAKLKKRLLVGLLH
jgi:hypothetical protein